jgi:biopolymer transport protein ExbB
MVQARLLFKRGLPMIMPICQKVRSLLSLLFGVTAPLALWVNAALAQAPSVPDAAGGVVGTPTLPRDLSPWDMFLGADPLVKAVLIGLAFASVVTWTVWLAKTIELVRATRRERESLRSLASAQRLSEAVEHFGATKCPVGDFLDAAESELRLSTGGAGHEGIKERIASRLERIEAACGRPIMRGTGVLATIGATAPFVGLFGTVWGIMNSFIGISREHTTNLAVVAPGIAGRCWRPPSGSQPPFRQWSSTICSLVRSRDTGPFWATRPQMCFGWLAAISTARPPDLERR